MNSLSGATGYSDSSGANLRNNSAGSYRSRKQVDQGDIVPKGQRVARMQNYTPQQMQQQESLYQHVGPDSYLSKIAGGDQAAFEEQEAPAWQLFQQAQGQLASRFSNQGLGGRNSSAFQNASGQLGSDFAMQLRSQRMAMRQNALKELMGYSDTILGQRPYDKALYDKQQKPKSFWQKLGGGALRAGGAATGGYFGGPMGGQAGYAAGDEFANAFGV
jgi:hypothetical protein